MVRNRLRSFWVQAGVVLAVILGIVVCDIAVAQARIADNNRKAALKALHRAEAAYAVKVDAISKNFYFAVQPVQDALDRLDVSKPADLQGARDAVVNSRTSATVSKFVPQLAALTPPRTMVTRHKTLQTSVKNVVKYLVALEKAKKAKEASDFLDTPYSSDAYSLSVALDGWHDSVTAIDAATARPAAPTPRPVGEERSKVKLPASKAGWIFAADHVCSNASHAMYALKDPGSNASLATYAKYEDRYGTILANVSTGLKKLPLPAADKRVLQRGVYKALHANDQLVTATRTLAAALRARSLTKLTDADNRYKLAIKGMGTLSHTFNAYGAEHCGWFFDPKPTKTTKGGGGGTVSA
jgi:hypothetical protein